MVHPGQAEDGMAGLGGEQGMGKMKNAISLDFRGKKCLTGWTMKLSPQTISARFDKPTTGERRVCFVVMARHMSGSNGS
ncbi:MAG: hypothetical protein WC058_10780 [Phycisphaeraceae bacterium]